MNPYDIKDTVVEVFDITYWVSVKAIEARSEEDILTRGIVLNRIDDIDEMNRQDVITKQCSINDMAEYYKKYVTIKILNVSDTENIYIAAQEHVRRWVSYLKNNFFGKSPPIDDLILLNNFAGSIYQYAKFYVYKDDPRYADINISGRVNHLNNIRMALIKRQIGAQDQIFDPGHNSYINELMRFKNEHN